MKFNKKKREGKKEEKSDLDIVKEFLLNKKILAVDTFKRYGTDALKLTLNCGGNILLGSSMIDHRGGNKFFYNIETRESLVEKLEKEIQEKRECLAKLEKEYTLIK